MKFVTEIIHDKQKTLIVSKYNYQFIKILKNHFKKYSVDHFFSSIVPKTIGNFDYYFFIEEEFPIQRLKDSPKKNFIFVFFQKNRFLHSLSANRLKNVKIIEINSHDLNQDDIEKILWFSLSKTPENHLKITKLTESSIRPSEQKFRMNIKKYFTKNNFIYMVISIFVFLHFLYVPFVLSSSIFAYRSYANLKRNNFTATETNSSVGKIINGIGQSLYSPVRPTYLLFGLASWPDNIFEINNNSFQTFSKITSVLDNAKEIQRLSFIKDKTSEEKNDLKLRFNKLNRSLEEINESLITINQKLDFPFAFVKKIKSNLIDVSDLIDKTRKLLVYAESVLTQEESKKYLIFFANNMELRPGGGFIGSFAILNAGDYEIGEIKVYDVYDADGQLTAHIDPPKPIEKYLKIPHWFLRDSNFSPDFIENYQKALFFVEKELGITNFSGGILLTTTAVENVLTAFDNLYLPDFKENINSKNFYLKTQFYAENNFFPGSIQKRVFLSSVVQQIILKLESMSSEKFLIALKKSLDEKQMAVFIDDPVAQTLFDTSFWSGRVIDPKCLSGADCISDYLFPYDANVGANKANFFINRFFYLKTTIDSEGKINHLLSIQYKNDSPSEVFPTGTYRNYFQVLLPLNSTIRRVTKDGVLVEEIDQKDDKFKLVGFFLEVPPKKTIEVKIDYQLAEKIDSVHEIYQLIFQKQMGANNSDLILDFNMDKNLSLINQNFSPLVKNNQILYNTSLSTDKIFFIELKKEL